jgi:methyl-accepting chemotaxis protein
VAAASGEQASGVNQVNRAMSQVDQVTQRNASAAEELSGTAEEMSAQADNLNQLMSFFQAEEVVYSYRQHKPAASHTSHSASQTSKPAASTFRGKANGHAAPTPAAENEAEFRAF